MLLPGRGFEGKPSRSPADKLKPILSQWAKCSTRRRLDEKVGQMFQVGLSALITKMCWARELPMKRSCVPSSWRVSVTKSTHYVNWIRLFSLFPQHLHHHLGIKAGCCNTRCSLTRPLELGWRAPSEGRCFWETSAGKLALTYFNNQLYFNTFFSHHYSMF